MKTTRIKLPISNCPQTISWWYWYGSETEANAYYLKLLATTDPKGLASRLVKYLLNNRQHATYWNSTRDTALAIEALADYLRASGEDKPDLTVEVWLDGKKQKEVKITRRRFIFVRQQIRARRGCGESRRAHLGTAQRPAPAHCITTPI